MGRDRASLRIKGAGRERELLSDLARKHIEASLWRELSRLVGAHLERARNDIVARQNPFAAIDPALFTREQRVDGAARLLEEMGRGSFAVPEELVQDIQALFGDVPLRCVLRDSQAYASSLEYLVTRRFSSNGQAARTKVEEVLHKGLPLGKDELVKSEMRSLLRGDIPTFSVAGRDLDLMDDMGQAIPSLFSVSAVDNALRRVDDLSKEGLSFLRSLLYEGFHAYPLRKETSVEPVRAWRCDEPLAPERAIREAEELLDVIFDHLIETPTGASG